MGARKPVPSWSRGLWRDLPWAERRALKAVLRELQARVGPFRDRLTRRYAKLAAEAWWTAEQASGAAVEVGVKRQHGRGRRPSLQAFDRRLKRQGLGVEAFDKLVRRLEELAGRDGDPHAALRALAARPAPPVGGADA